jgi:hypothetical protein
MRSVRAESAFFIPGQGSRETAMASDEHGDLPEDEGRMSRQQLLACAFTRVREGALPRTVTPRMYAGPAKDGCCALCDRPFSHRDVEYEVLWERPDGTDQEYRFHILCFHVWKEACDAGHSPAP